MKKMMHIEIGKGLNKYTINFGMPDSKDELQKMYKLRYEAYSAKGHILPNSGNIDIDNYDKEKKCYYFIAVVDDVIVGSTRIILGNKLPTLDEYFNLDLPKEIKKIPREKIVEIGRLVSFHKGLKIKLPRHIVLMSLFYIMIKFSKRKNLLVAVGTLKDYVKMKLARINFPMYSIKSNGLEYNPKEMNDPLINFFNEETGRVWPIYIFIAEAESYLNSIYQNKKIFKRIDNNHIILKSSVRYQLQLLKKVIA